MWGSIGLVGGMFGHLEIVEELEKAFRWWDSSLFLLRGL